MLNSLARHHSMDMNQIVVVLVTRHRFRSIEIPVEGNAVLPNRHESVGTGFTDGSTDIPVEIVPRSLCIQTEYFRTAVSVFIHRKAPKIFERAALGPPSPCSFTGNIDSGLTHHIHVVPQHLGGLHHRRSVESIPVGTFRHRLGRPLSKFLFGKVIRQVRRYPVEREMTNVRAVDLRKVVVRTGRDCSGNRGEKFRERLNIELHVDIRPSAVLDPLKVTNDLFERHRFQRIIHLDHAKRYRLLCLIPLFIAAGCR